LVVVTVVVATLIVAVTLLLLPATALLFLFALLTGTDGGSGNAADGSADKRAFGTISVTAGEGSNGRSGGDAGSGTTLGGSASHREKSSAEGETQNELIFHVH
jgi:pectate lyase